MARKPSIKKTLDDVELKQILDKPKEKNSAESDKEKLESIRQELMTLPEWEDYPCRYCETADPMECASQCKQWEAWFRYHYRQCRKEGLRIAYNRDIREARISRERANKSMNELFEELAGVGIFGEDLRGE